MVKSNRKIKEIYLDHASATPMDAKTEKVFIDASRKLFANSGAIHSLGISANNAINQARKNIASILYVHPEEIIFTSGATESNNLAILGILKNKKSSHIVTTNIEHASVLEACKSLDDVSVVSVEPNGIVNTDAIKKAITKDTVLVSVMYANNEIGTIQPIEEIAKVVRHFRKVNKSQFPLFHTDATQAMNYLPIKVQKLGVDLMTLNSGKIYGPKGIGLLFVRRGLNLEKILWGGGQENNFRPGTENTPAILAFSEAMKITENLKLKETKRLMILRDYFISELKKNIPDVIINGDLKNRLANNVNITIPKIPSDLLVIELSARGIYISEKSACKSGEKKASYVISALRKENLESLRFSLGRDTTKKDLGIVVKNLNDILKKLKKWYI